VPDDKQGCTFGPLKVALNNKAYALTDAKGHPVRFFLTTAM
jgi:hypothetical protein